MRGQTAVYRLYAPDDALLYVGVAAAPERRFMHHAKSKRWWREVARRDIRWHPDRAAALRAEAEAIHAEAPRYNAVVPHPDGSLRGSTVRVTPEIARVPAPSGYRRFAMDDDLWERLDEAARRVDPDSNRSALLRRLARWYVGDIDELPQRPGRKQAAS